VYSWVTTNRITCIAILGQDNPIQISMSSYTKLIRNLYETYTQLIRNLYETYTQLIRNLYGTYAKLIRNLYETYTKRISSVFCMQLLCEKIRMKCYPVKRHFLYATSFEIPDLMISESSRKSTKWHHADVDRFSVNGPILLKWHDIVA
jgi:hypothetical protein